MEAALKEHAPLPISLRILTLDFNFLGTRGADVLAEAVKNSRILKILSIQRCRLVGKSLLKFSDSLAKNKTLKVLNLGMNPLNDTGVAYLCSALKRNQCLEVLDLFDVDFGAEGAIELGETLLVNKTLLHLRLANTSVPKHGSTPLINAATGSQSLKVFRWSNLHPLPVGENYRVLKANKLISLNSRTTSVSRSVYVNSHLGDLTMDLLKSVYQCQYYSQDLPGALEQSNMSEL